MARKREISSFTDIQSDEDFENFLSQKVLLVLDVYQELFGPCVSLQSTLEKKKISLANSDSLQMATCNADKIEKLNRFRNKCNPTIVFCLDQKVVDICYGANIPQLIIMIEMYTHLIDNELKKSQPLYEFDEPLPFEMEAIEQQMREEAERIRIRNETAQAEKLAELDRIIELMNKNVPDMGITLFMPHVAQNAFRKTQETAKWLSLVNRAEKMIQITPEMMETLNYNLENPIDERILEEIYNKDILAVLWYTDPRNLITDVLQDFIKHVSEPQERVSEEEGKIIWVTILEPLIIDPIDETQSGSGLVENHEFDAEDELINVEDFMSVHSDEGALAEESSDARISRSVSRLDDNVEQLSDSEMEDNRLKIPPVWTPSNQSGNAIFMHYFFRNQFETFLPPIAEPEPEHLCMIFPAKMRNEVMEICEEHPNDLLNYGFFDGEDFENFQPVCKSVESYDNLLGTGKEKMILKVSKKTSLLALDLVSLNPLHISQNVKDGQEECEMIFIETPEDDTEESDVESN